MKPHPLLPIFLVEDDTKLSGLIKEYLERHHFQVSVENDGSQAVPRILKENPALVVLDILLPGKDGRTICRELRNQYNGPIVMLTALNEEIDQIVGLEIGADDYITKPMRPRLLLSRINALLRLGARSGGREPGKAPTPPHERNVDRIALGRLEIHLPSRTVLAGGNPVELTTSEFDLLAYLTRNAGRVVKRDQLFRDLRGRDYDGLNRTIDLTVVRLRNKIGDDGNHPQIIKTIRGEGYMMVDPP